MKEKEKEKKKKKRGGQRLTPWDGTRNTFSIAILQWFYSARVQIGARKIPFGKSSDLMVPLYVSDEFFYFNFYNYYYYYCYFNTINNATILGNYLLFVLCVRVRRVSSVPSYTHRPDSGPAPHLTLARDYCDFQKKKPIIIAYKTSNRRGFIWHHWFTLCTPCSICGGKKKQEPRTITDAGLATLRSVRVSDVWRKFRHL